MTSATEAEHDVARSSRQTQPLHKRMLFVGPLPPPRTGTHVSFQLLCDAVRDRLGNGSLQVIDTSQKYQKRNPRIASWGNLKQCWKVSRQFRHQVREAEYVLLFGSNGFIFSMTPLLRMLAGRRPFYVHICGGSMDVFAKKLNPLFRWILHRTLAKATGVVVQTRYLREQMAPVLGENVVASPNRRNASTECARPGNGSSTRIVYVSTIRKDKGIFVLLESLRRLADAGARIHCDIYGELWPADEEEFRRQLALVPNAEYKGYVEPERVAATMSGYDALVLPTFYQGEGHPGVLVEAMMVGLPVVATDFRSIPEVVEHEGNGLLVQPQNVEDLQGALTKLETHPSLLVEMSERALAMRSEFDAANVLPQYMQLLGLFDSNTD